MLERRRPANWRAFSVAGACRLFGDGHFAVHAEREVRWAAFDLWLLTTGRSGCSHVLVRIGTGRDGTDDRVPARRCEFA